MSGVEEEREQRPAASHGRRSASAGRAGGLLRESEFSVADAVGGWRGVLESVLPTLLFIVLFAVTHSIVASSLAAVAVVVVTVAARLIQRQSASSAIGGLLGVAIGALWAIRTGDGSGFYLPGLVTNAVALLVVIVSILARRPLVAIVAALVDPRVADWAQDRDAVRTYTRATWLFAGLYAAKLAVETPLYLLGLATPLGIAKIAMGLPLFALVLWLVWLMHRALLHRRGAVTTG